MPARGRGRSASAADTVCSAETTFTPSGTISAAAWAAEPCHTPSMRVALAAHRRGQRDGRVDQQLSGGSEPFRMFLSVSDWLRNGTLRIIVSRALDGLGVLGAGEVALGHRCRAPDRPLRCARRRRAIRSRSAPRVWPRRTASPKPSAPDAPMIATGSIGGAAATAAEYRTAVWIPHRETEILETCRVSRRPRHASPVAEAWADAPMT